MCIGKIGMWLLAFPRDPEQYRGNEAGCPDPFQPGCESTSFPGTRISEEGRLPHGTVGSIAEVSEVDGAQQLLQHYSENEI